MALHGSRSAERREGHPLCYFRRAEGCRRQRSQEDSASGLFVLRQTSGAEKNMTLRKMVVVRAPSTNNCPMVRIANRMLKLHGFAIGVPIEVAYEQNVITLRIIENANKLQTPRSPVAIPAASSQADAGKRDGHAGRTKSDSADATKTMPSPIRPLRWVLSGHWSHGGAKDAWHLGC